MTRSRDSLSGIFAGLELQNQGGRRLDTHQLSLIECKHPILDINDDTKWPYLNSKHITFRNKYTYILYFRFSYPGTADYVTIT